MPNWCDNILIIKGDPRQLKDLIKKLIVEEEGKKVMKLSAFFPRYDPNDTPKADITNLQTISEITTKCRWGTKWEPDIHNIEEENKRLIIEFMSAWSPPDKFLKIISKQFLGLDFILDYSEGGNNFRGRLIIEKGKIEQEVCVGYDDVVPEITNSMKFIKGKK